MAISVDMYFGAPVALANHVGGRLPTRRASSTAVVSAGPGRQIMAGTAGRAWSGQPADHGREDRQSMAGTASSHPHGPSSTAVTTTIAAFGRSPRDSADQPQKSLQAVSRVSGTSGQLR